MTGACPSAEGSTPLYPEVARRTPLLLGCCVVRFAAAVGAAAGGGGVDGSGCGGCCGHGALRVANVGAVVAAGAAEGGGMSMSEVLKVVV